MPNSNVTVSPNAITNQSTNVTQNSATTSNTQAGSGSQGGSDTSTTVRGGAAAGIGERGIGAVSSDINADGPGMRNQGKEKCHNKHDDKQVKASTRNTANKRCCDRGASAPVTQCRTGG